MSVSICGDGHLMAAKGGLGMPNISEEGWVDVTGSDSTSKGATRGG